MVQLCKLRETSAVCPMFLLHASVFNFVAGWFISTHGQAAYGARCCVASRASAPGYPKVRLTERAQPDTKNAPHHARKTNDVGIVAMVSNPFRLRCVPLFFIWTALLIQCAI